MVRMAKDYAFDVLTRKPLLYVASEIRVASALVPLRRAAVLRANTAAMAAAINVAPTVIAPMATPAAPVTLVFAAVEPGAPEAQPVSVDRAALTISSATITPSAAPVL